MMAEGNNLRRAAIVEAITEHPAEEAQVYVEACRTHLDAVLAGRVELRSVIPAVYVLLARALVFSEAV